MAKDMDCDRRRFLGAALMTFAAARPVRASADAQFETAGHAQPTTTTRQAKTSFSSLKQIDAGVLNVGYAEDGPSSTSTPFDCGVSQSLECS